MNTVDALVQLSFRVQAALVEAGRDADLTLTQVRLLGILRDREPSMQELAAHLEMDKSSLSGLIDRAEAKGLVRRRPHPTDGRSAVVVLTPAGRRTATAGEQAVTQRIAEMTGVLTPRQERELCVLAQKLLAAPPSCS